MLLWRAGLYLFVVDLAQVSGRLEVFQLKRTQLCLTFVHCNLEAHLHPLLVRGVLAKLSVGNRTMPLRIAPSETSYSNINELNRGGSNSHVNFTQFNRPQIRHFKRLNWWWLTRKLLRFTKLSGHFRTWSEGKMNKHRTQTYRHILLIYRRSSTSSDQTMQKERIEWQANRGRENWWDLTFEFPGGISARVSIRRFSACHLM